MSRLKAKEKDSKLLSPAIGYFTPAIKKGAAVAEGQLVGTLTRLGKVSSVYASGSGGLIKEVAPHGPVHFESMLAEIDTSAGVAKGSAGTSKKQKSGKIEVVAEFPGRFYSRPNPESDAFVSVGDVVKHGDVLCLIEVMKTFTRVTYGGDYPATAKVVALVAEEGSDISAGDVLVRLDPI